MACRALYVWNLSDLIGSFVDLAIAYFLLCASVVVYIASKFLGVFGLCLPCPCTLLGRGTFPNSNYCLQRLLIDCPTGIVSKVQLSVLNKFPFNEIGRENDPNSNFGGYMIEGQNRNTGNGYVEMIEGEGSCSSVSDARKGHHVKRLDWEPDRRKDDSVVEEGRFDVKGKGVVNERPRGWLRRRRGEAYSKRNSSVASCDPQVGDVCGGYSSLSDGISKGGTEMVEDIIGHLDNGIDSHDSYYLDNSQASRVIMLGQRDVILTDEFPKENDEEDKLSSSLVANAEPPQHFSASFGDKNAVTLLEQALREEQAARTALYIELEKERNAAASAADEAMAMILRLQEEKATVEMEARQYQRIIEEKSAYDAEEMNILKDILLIREREKHFLEEEVEEYRQMINLANEQFEDDELEIEKEHLNPLVDPSEDHVFIIDQPSALIDEKASWEAMQTSFCSSNGEQNVQEKEMILISGHLYVPPQDGQRQEATTIACETSRTLEHILSEKRIQVAGGEGIPDGPSVILDKMDSYGGTDAHILRQEENMEQHKVEAFHEVKESSMVISDKEPLVHDIHVIVDEPGLPGELERRQDTFLLANDISKTIIENFQHAMSSRRSIGVIGDPATTSSIHSRTEIQRSTSEIPSRLPPVVPQQKSILSDQRRNSMSSIDNERFKIDHEIGWLRERLKIIQEGREKLNLSKEHRERENVQLNILEDIARQLQAIRLLTESGKALRQESLPPPFTKVTSKKRRSRSASSGLHKSS